MVLVLTTGCNIMALTDRLPALLRTAEQMALLQGSETSARVLSEARPSLLLSGVDEWNGIVQLYTLVLEIPVATYVELLTERSELERKILERVKLQTRFEANESVSEVVISPLPVEESVIRKGNSEATGDDLELTPAFWQNGYFRLFVSHVSDHGVIANELKESLAQFQIAAFVAHTDIQPTTEWQNEIESALRTMDALTAMLTPEFLNSCWCDQEVGYALGRNRFVLALRIGADPHGFMAKIQGLSVNGLGADEMAERIFNVLISHESTTQRMTESLVERLVKSRSFESSKRTIQLVEKAKHLNNDQVARLLGAISENVDVREAYGVPDRIRMLVKRIGEKASL